MTRPADIQSFAERIATLADPFGERKTPWFDPKEGAIISRAPGRLDVMGGIADYSGSLVLQWPIAEATWVAVQHQKPARIQVCSLSPTRDGVTRRFAIETQELARLARAGYETARAALHASEEMSWVPYVLGTLVVLHRERGFDLEGGLRILVTSDVPEGKGVSSSAAIEVATMHAIAQHASLALDGHELARLCQLAENLVAGAPCGIMDQMTASLGREGRLLQLLCQPATVRGFVDLPEHLAFFGIDSGVRHAVSGSDYGRVRVGAFMGYRILAELAGLTVTPGDRPGHVVIDDTLWGGYLANVPSIVFESEYVEHLPETIRGSVFLERYQGITDLVTHVDPDVTYAVRQPTRHPIHEHERVVRFAALLGDDSDEALRELGELMVASHDSYGACGLGSQATDRIVNAMLMAGPEEGVYGAKITGGGSGGTVAILARPEARDLIEMIARDVDSPLPPFVGSSPGVRSFVLFR